MTDGSRRFDSRDGRYEMEADLIVHGAGRVPNLEGMDLPHGRVESSENGVCVNEYLQSTSNPSVFACGDCAGTGVNPLTPTANQEGRTIVKNSEDARPI